MHGLLGVIVLIIVGAWGWAKFGDDVSIIWNSSKSVVETSADEIGKAKDKIGKALSVFDNLDLGDKDKKTSTNHRVTKVDKRICRVCKEKIKIGIWGSDNICHKCFQLTKRE